VSVCSLFEKTMRINNSVSGFSSCQTIEQFHQARFVRIAHGRFAICLDPFRVLYPQIVVNLLPELGVSVDLMMSGRWLGERFLCGAGRFVQLALSVSALPSKTDKFHKRLSSADGWFTPTRRPFLCTTHSSGTADALETPKTRS
jgi:hypothetical protein